MEKRKQLRHTPDEMAVEFRRMWREGVRYSVIMETLGLSRHQVQHVRQKLGLGTHPEYCSGNTARKHSPDTRQKCIELRESGLSCRQIGEILGVNRKTVSALIHDFRKRDYRRVEEIIPVSAPAQVLAEREHRLALAPRDITAALFGDPLPGYSALERRT